MNPTTIEIVESPGRYVIAVKFEPGVLGKVFINSDERVTTFGTGQTDVMLLEYLLPGDVVTVNEGEISLRKVEYVT